MRRRSCWAQAEELAQDDPPGREVLHTGVLSHLGAHEICLPAHDEPSGHGQHPPGPAVLLAYAQRPAPDLRVVPAWAWTVPGLGQTGAAVTAWSS